MSSKYSQFLEAWIVPALSEGAVKIEKDPYEKGPAAKCTAFGSRPLSVYTVYPDWKAAYCDP